MTIKFSQNQLSGLDESLCLKLSHSQCQCSSCYDVMIHVTRQYTVDVQLCCECFGDINLYK